MCVGSSEATGGCELPGGCRDLNQGPLEEQQLVPFTTEDLSSPVCVFETVRLYCPGWCQTHGFKSSSPQPPKQLKVQAQDHNLLLLIIIILHYCEFRCIRNCHHICFKTLECFSACFSLHHSCSGINPCPPSQGGFGLSQAGSPVFGTLKSSFPHIFFLSFLFFFSMRGIKNKALHRRDTHSNTELHPHPVPPSSLCVPAPCGGACWLSIVNSQQKQLTLPFKDKERDPPLPFFLEFCLIPLEAVFVWSSGWP